MRLLWTGLRSGCKAVAMRLRLEELMLRRRTPMPWRCELCQATGDGNAAEFHRHYMIEHWNGRMTYGEDASRDR